MTNWDKLAKRDVYVKQLITGDCPRFWIRKRPSFNKLPHNTKPISAEFKTGDRVAVNGAQGFISAIKDRRRRVYVHFDGTAKPMECNPEALKKL